MNNIQDILTAYYLNDSDTIIESKVSKVPLQQLAEMKAYMEKDTEQGKEIYDIIIRLFKGALNEY